VHHLSDVYLVAALVIATKPSSSGQKGPPGRAAGLDRMVADAEEAVLYELPSDVPFERLPIEDGGE
jgi:hypothetical protein